MLVRRREQETVGDKKRHSRRKRGERQLGLLYFLARHSPLNEYRIAIEVESMGLGSKPTVREDLRELESEGYIETEMMRSAHRKPSKGYKLAYRGFAEVIADLANNEKNLELVNKLLEKHQHFVPEVFEIWQELRLNQLDRRALEGLQRYLHLLLASAALMLGAGDIKQTDKHGQGKSILDSEFDVLDHVMASVLSGDGNWYGSFQRSPVLRKAIMDKMQQDIESLRAMKKGLDDDLSRREKLLDKLRKLIS